MYVKYVKQNAPQNARDANPSGIVAESIRNKIGKDTKKTALLHLYN
jgi:hypothetical protein